MGYAPECPACSGDGAYLGQLGRRLHFRCIHCGINFSILEDAS